MKKKIRPTLFTRKDDEWNKIYKFICKKYIYVRQSAKAQSMTKQYHDKMITQEVYYSFMDNLLDVFNNEYGVFLKWRKDADKLIDLRIKQKVAHQLDLKLFDFYKSTKDELILRNDDALCRLYIHNRCDQLFLAHDTKINELNTIVIIKTDKMDLSKIGEISVKKSKKKKERSYECNDCSTDLCRDEAFVSPYISGIYCMDCLETNYEGMKYEPL
jgi:hypothetical protein